MSLVKVKEKFQVTIPTAVRKNMRLEVGDFLEAVIENNAITFKPKTLVDRDSVEAAIEEGWNDKKAGRMSPKFSTVEEYHAWRKNR